MVNAYVSGGARRNFTHIASRLEGVSFIANEMVGWMIPYDNRHFWGPLLISNIIISDTFGVVSIMSG